MAVGRQKCRGVSKAFELLFEITRLIVTYRYSSVKDQCGTGVSGLNAKVKPVDLNGYGGVRGQSKRQDPGSKTEPGAPSASVQTVS